MKRFATILACITIAAAALAAPLAAPAATPTPNMEILISTSPEGPFYPGDQVDISVSIINKGDVTFSTVDWAYYMDDRQMALITQPYTNVEPGGERGLTSPRWEVGEAAAGKTIEFKVVVTAETTGGETVTFTETHDLTVYYGAPAKPSIEHCTIEMSWSSVDYDGTSQIPTLTVTDGDYTLQEDVDYTVQIVTDYGVGNPATEAVDAGDYSLNIVGAGNYEGSAWKDFRIERRRVIVRVDNVGLDWTGSELFGKTEYFVDEGFAWPLASGHTATVTYTPASGTAVGTYDNGFFDESTFKVVDSNDNEVTANYSPSFVPGKLTIQAVTKPSIEDCEITLSWTEESYDGASHTPNLTLSYGDETLQKGVDYTVQIIRLEDQNPVDEAVDAGSYSLHIRGIGGYEGHVEKEFDITRRRVSVRVDDKTADWTGEELYGNTEYTIVGFDIYGLLSGHTATVTYTAAHGTAVGTYENGSFDEESFTVTDSNGNDMTANYWLINTIPGKLTIQTPKKPISSVIEISGESTTYDGTPQSPIISVKDGDYTLQEGTDYTLKIRRISKSDDEGGSAVPHLTEVTEAVDAGEYRFEISGMGNYGGYGDYSFTISPRPVTVRVSKKSVEWTGEPLDGNEECTFSNLVSGHTATIIYVPSRGIDVGTYDNGQFFVRSFQAKDGSNKDVTANYEIVDATPGKLIIRDKGRKNPIRDCTISPITANISKFYDGTSQLPTITITDDDYTLQEGTDYTVRILAYGELDIYPIAEAIDVGTYRIEISGTGEYEGTIVISYSIFPRSVTVSVADKTADWTGEVIEGNSAYTFDNVVSGHTATITYTPASGKDVNTYDNGAFGSDFQVVDSNGIDVTSNYELTRATAGKLTIQAVAKRSITDCEIDISWRSKDYSGDSQIPTLTITDGDYTLQEGTDYTVLILRDGVSDKPVTEAVDVGEYMLVISGMDNYEDAERQYFVIKPRRVVIRVDHTIATWTGSELYGETEYFDDDGYPLVSGHTATVTYSPAHGTAVGTYDNGSYDEDSFTVVDSNGNDVTANYSPRFSAGKLTIKAPAKTPISSCAIQLSWDGRPYDGANQVPDVTITDGDYTLQEGKDYTVTLITTGDTPITEAVDAGDYMLRITGTGSYENTTYKGFNILPREVLVRVNDKTLDWTGNVLYGNTEYYIAVYDMLVSGHTATVTYIPASGIAEGTYDNGSFDEDSFKVVDGSGNDVTANYGPGFVPGKLTIQAPKRSIEDCSVESSWYGRTYDGTSQIPTLTITDGEYTLKEGTDYTVMITKAGDPHNPLTEVVDVGNYDLTITGTGNYKDRASIELQIGLRHVAVLVEDKTADWTGDELYGNTECHYDAGDTALASGHTATVTYTPAYGTDIGTYSNGVFVESSFEVIDADGNEVTANYEPVFYPGSLIIQEPAKIPFSSCSVQLSWTQKPYNGAYQVPDVTVTYGSTILREGTDFTVDYPSEEALPVGGYQLTINGAGSYEGGAIESFAITIREVTVAVADKTVDWTGEELCGETAYTFENVVDGHTASITYTAAHGADADTYNNGVFDKGSFTVLDSNSNDVTSNYELSGMTAGKLTIQAVTPPTPTGPEITQQPADKTAAKDALTFFQTAAKGVGTIQYQWMYRTSESSEPIAMSDDSNWYDTGTAIVKVFGRSAFNGYQFACDVTDDNGTVRTDWATLTIQEPTPTEPVSVQVDMVPSTVAVGMLCNVTVVVTNNGDGTIASLTLHSSFDGQSMTDQSTTNLGPGQSFTFEYHDVYVTRLPDSGELEFIARAVDDDTTKEYTGTGKVKVIPSIRDCTIVFAEQVYTGSEITPVPTITWGDRTLEEGKDFKISYYMDNLKAGSASALILGKGDFGGSVEYPFTIKPREVTVSVADKTVVWTGEELYGNTRYTFDNLVSGHVAAITYTPASGQDAATYNNGAFGNDFQVLDGNGSDVTRNYELVSAIPGKLTIKAYFTLTIEYVYAKGGTISTYKDRLEYGTEYDVKSPDKEGYTPDQDRITGNLYDDTSFTVTYTGNPATITLDLGEGTLDGKTGTIEIPARYGDIIYLPTGTPTLAGHTFQYWQGSKYNPGDEYTVTVDHTLTAVYKKNSPTVPATGDATPLALAIGLALLAATAAAVALAFARRRG